MREAELPSDWPIHPIFLKYRLQFQMYPFIPHPQSVYVAGQGPAGQAMGGYVQTQGGYVQAQGGYVNAAGHYYPAAQGGYLAGQGPGGQAHVQAQGGYVQAAGYHYPAAQPLYPPPVYFPAQPVSGHQAPGYIRVTEPLYPPAPVPGHASGCIAAAQALYPPPPGPGQAPGHIHAPPPLACNPLPAPSQQQHSDRSREGGPGARARSPRTRSRSRSRGLDRGAGRGGGGGGVVGAHGQGRFTLKEVRGDLFSSPSTDSLAHCVSRDFKLGKGIAKIFLEKFGKIDELKRSHAILGGLAVLKEDRKYIYNLVTKEKYSDKPSYESLRSSLEAMKQHSLDHGVESISMPKIGCGLDGLSWPAVKTLIMNVFQQENLRITVYYQDLPPYTMSRAILDKLEENILFDSHCHIDFIMFWRSPELELESFDQFVNAYSIMDHPSLEGFITNFCNPKIWLEHMMPISPLVHSLLVRHSVFYTLGCHPHYAYDLLNMHNYAKLEMLVMRAGTNCVAIGECGLDTSSKNNVKMEDQVSVFIKQMKLAMRCKKPLVLHIRGAEEKALEAMREAELPSDWPIHRYQHILILKFIHLFTVQTLLERHLGELQCVADQVHEQCGGSRPPRHLLLCQGHGGGYGDAASGQAGSGNRRSLLPP